jgi:hypothetical protein
LSTPSVVGVGEVDSCGAHLVELLTGARDGVGEVDDVHDLGAAEAGDLHSTHGEEAKAWPLRAARHHAAGRRLAPPIGCPRGGGGELHSSAAPGLPGGAQIVAGWTTPRAAARTDPRRAVR